MNKYNKKEQVTNMIKDCYRFIRSLKNNMIQKKQFLDSMYSNDKIFLSFILIDSIDNIILYDITLYIII